MEDSEDGRPEGEPEDGDVRPDALVYTGSGIASTVAFGIPTITQSPPRAMSPGEWCAAIFPSESRPHPDLWKHEAAAALHGWAAHRHHAGQPIQLTRADYEAAVAIVEGVQPYTPHQTALSEHRGEQ